jgi:site-specific DNA-methyltransferase (adenine-specific)
MDEMPENTIVNADCIEWLKQQPEGFADLVFADPPFNIGYQYDVYEDRMAYDEYYNWTRRWMAGCCRALKADGTFWIAIGDDYAAEIRMLGRELGLTLRNWVIWHYTFGQNTKRKFARSHTHLFYFVKDPTDFVFEDKATRVFSDRQRVYKDKRANEDGKLPDDVWSEFPRVCGTFGEREGWHPCQMPETVLGRIIRTTSRQGSVVMDPFAGSGTTLVVAKKLSRKYVGIEISSQYVERMKQRLASTKPLADIEGERTGKWAEGHLQELKGMYLEAGLPTDFLRKNPRLLMAFVQRFNWRLERSGVVEGYAPEEVWAHLERLRKSGKLGKIRVHAEEDMAPPVQKLPDDWGGEVGYYGRESKSGS